jgi:hypothetical protein
MRAGPSIPLALAAVSSEDAAEILIWSAVLIGLVILLAIVMVVAKRRSASQPAQSAPFTLGELRKLREQGQLTDEEYQRTRNSLIGMTGAGTGGEADSTASETGSGTAHERPDTGPADPGKKSGEVDRADEEKDRDGNGDERNT